MDAATPELRGLFLDFDGTVAETERCGHRVAYNRAFADLGLDWEWNEDLYGELLAVAGGRERMRFYLERYRPELLASAEASGLLAEVHRVKAERFAELAPSIPLRPGVLALARRAHAAGVKVAIVTTASQVGVDALLRLHPALAAAVDLVVAGDVVPRKKPAPDVYLAALGRLGLRAADCVAIEDSAVGLAAALAAGVATVVTASEYTAREDFSGAAAVLSGLGERGRPARSIAGPAPPAGVVDLAYLQAVLQRENRYVRPRQPLQPGPGHGEQMNATTGAFTVQRAAERATFDHGWLHTSHSFSFASYFDPQNLNWGALRVFNDDVVAPGKGFGTHPHRDMEILTYVLEGELEHKDSLGNVGVVAAGSVQYLSAGTGLQHSEYNHSGERPVHFVQMWVLPRAAGLAPRYGQTDFTVADRTNRWLAIASGETGLRAPIAIWQDASAYVARLEGAALAKSIPAGRFAFLFVAAGEVALGTETLHAGDAVRISGPFDIDVSGSGELVLWDVPPLGA